jgi:hypothetical protein
MPLRRFTRLPMFFSFRFFPFSLYRAVSPQAELDFPRFLSMLNRAADLLDNCVEELGAEGGCAVNEMRPHHVPQFCRDWSAITCSCTLLQPSEP